MAKAFDEVFGTALLVAPLDAKGQIDDAHMPSPHALRKKIILKHKKLPEGASGVVVEESSTPGAVRPVDDRSLVHSNGERTCHYRRIMMFPAIQWPPLYERISVPVV